MAAPANKVTVTIFVFFSLVISTTGIGLQEVVENVDSALGHPSIDFPPITSFKKKYDFIIIGCGASGSLLANRLSEIPSFQVLCIEAGHKENAITDVPVLSSLLANTQYDWKYKTAREDGQCESFLNSRCSWPRGKALGGSTVINTMVYTRANAKDYDHWAQLGNYGWGFKDILPYLKKFENFRKIKGEDETIRGFDGELNIEEAKFETGVLQYIIKSAEEQGIPKTDVNGKQQIGISRLQAMTRNGRRLSAAKAFLYPVRNRTNLQIAPDAFVTKIIIDARSKIAKGVEISIGSVTHIVGARKEVILSGGTINSPQLLMLSGVGPRRQLEKFNINVIKDLPVGQFLKDHAAFFGLFYTMEVPTTTLPAFPILNYLFHGGGPLAVPSGAEAIVFINAKNTSYFTHKHPHSEPDIELLISGAGGAIIEKAFGIALGLKYEFYRDIFSSARGPFGINIQPVNLKPKSIGRLELSSSDPFAKPKIYPNYYTDEADLETMLLGVRMATKIALGEPLQPFRPKLHEFQLRQCSQFPFNTDDFWKCALKLMPNTVYHPIGTCKMGPDNDRGAVVDPELRVKGIKRLRVVDASIMPEIPSAHLTSTCYAIAEKAAAMIKEAHGVSDK